jgi:hypothetical protein
MPEIWTVVVLVIYPSTTWSVVDLLHRVVSIRIVWRRRVSISIISRLVLIEALLRVCRPSWRRSQWLALRISAAAIPLRHWLLLHCSLLAWSTRETRTEDAFPNPKEYAQHLKNAE